jgi:hypothetical protein
MTGNRTLRFRHTVHKRTMENTATHNFTAIVPLPVRLL